MDVMDVKNCVMMDMMDVIMEVMMDMMDMMNMMMDMMDMMMDMMDMVNMNTTLTHNERPCVPITPSLQSLYVVCKNNDVWTFVFIFCGEYGLIFVFSASMVCVCVMSDANMYLCGECVWLI